MKNTKDLKDIYKDYEISKKWFLSLIKKTQHKISHSKKSIQKLHKQKVKRTKKFLKFLGNPQKSYKSIHIAGTSGKGSTAVILNRLLEASGFKVGLHIKPYLQEPIEKLVINSKMITPSKFASLVDFFKEKYEKFLTCDSVKVIPRYSEAWLALTLLYFSQEKVDFTIVETDVGGRFSPSNVLEPEVCIITTVYYDHIKLLGPTLKNIAWHKAGIIKPNTPVVVGKCPPEALSIIEKEAKEKKAPLYVFEKDFNIKIIHSSYKGIIFNLFTPFGNLKKIQLPLQGRSQAHNFALAFLSYKLLQQKHRFTPIKFLNKTLKDLSFPGRLEIVQKNPTVILDVAHNLQKISLLTQTIKENYPDVKEKILIIGLLETKDANSIVKELVGLFDTIITTVPQVYGKTPFPAVKLKKIFKNLSPSNKIITVPEPKETVKKALNLVSHNDLIVITGSIYLVGNARELWHPSKKLLWEAEKGV